MTAEQFIAQEYKYDIAKIRSYNATGSWLSYGETGNVQNGIVIDNKGDPDSLSYDLTPLNL